jgi:Zn-dependent protease with chaperone function
VTRGLVDLLDQRELAAAIAHEVGHLLDGGHVHTVVSLGGCTDPDVEIRADAIGVRLLEQQETGRDAMISMLEKVCASSAAPQACRPGIRRRIEALSTKLKTVPAMPRP